MLRLPFVGEWCKRIFFRVLFCRKIDTKWLSLDSFFFSFRSIVFSRRLDHRLLFLAAEMLFSFSFLYYRNPLSVLLDNNRIVTVALHSCCCCDHCRCILYYLEVNVGPPIVSHQHDTNHTNRHTKNKRQEKSCKEHNCCTVEKCQIFSFVSISSHEFVQFALNWIDFLR